MSLFDGTLILWPKFMKYNFFDHGLSKLRDYRQDQISAQSM